VAGVDVCWQESLSCLTSFLTPMYGAEDLLCYFLIHMQSFYVVIVLKNVSGDKVPPVQVLTQILQMTVFHLCEYFSPSTPSYVLCVFVLSETGKLSP